MMFVKNIRDCEAFTANDGCLIRELMHPNNDPVELSCSMAHARVAKGEQTYRHKLKQAEVYFILRGKGSMHINDEIREVLPGDTVYIPPQAVQWIENTGDTELEFLALVSPPWNERDDTRVK